MSAPLERRLPLLVLPLGHGPAEAFPTRSGCRERRLGAGRDLLALMLGNGGEQVHGDGSWRRANDQRGRYGCHRAGRSAFSMRVAQHPA